MQLFTFIGRDPRYWQGGEEFKPERFTGANSELQFNGNYFELIPFGAGRRICPGMSFAVAILEVTLANILYHFNWELPVGVKPEELDVNETFGFNMKKISPLLVHAQPYLSHD
jgi:cytochrome P450